MRILAIVHQRDAGPGVFEDAIRDTGAQLDDWLVPAQSHPPRDLSEYGAAITFGGAMHVDQGRKHPWLAAETALLRSLIEQCVPLLGVCLGAQLVAAAAGAEVGRAAAPEIGWCEVETTREGAEDPLLGPLAPQFEALEWHSYEFSLPPGAVALARSSECLQAFRLDRAADGGSTWGIQFHAEVSGEDFDSWIDEYRSDPDAVSMGLDPQALRDDTRVKMTAWNALGRDLCTRFVALAGEARRR